MERLLASATDLPVVHRTGSERGPAHGAARLARLAVGDGPLETICDKAPVASLTLPDARIVEACADRLNRFRRLYRAVRNEFPPLPA